MVLGYNEIMSQIIGAGIADLGSLREGIGDCLECGNTLSRMIPSTFVINTLQKYMPEVMAASCIKCHRDFLIQRVKPYGVRGTITRKKEDIWQESIFFADEGELIVSQGEEICQ